VDAQLSSGTIFILKASCTGICSAFATSECARGDENMALTKNLDAQGVV